MPGVCLKAGPLDVRIRVGPPVPLSSFADRKDLARQSEAEVREHVVRILRERGARRAHSDRGATGGARARSAKTRQRQGRQMGLTWLSTPTFANLDKSLPECCHAT